jgi:hemolysin activation/secretion protein
MLTNWKRRLAFVELTKQDEIGFHDTPSEKTKASDLNAGQRAYSWISLPAGVRRALGFGTSKPEHVMIAELACLGGRVRIGVAILASVAGMNQALAQSVSPAQVTPQNIRPVAPANGPPALPTAAGLTPPPNAANLSITLSNVVVENGFPELADETASLTAPIKGRRVSLAEIYAVANAIEHAYAARGYVLARVVVPKQKLDQGGVLRLVIVDGTIESVDVNGVGEKQRALVSARMSSLIGRRHLTIKEIERQLLLTADIPGIALTSTLQRGATPGGTILVLDAKQSTLTGTVGIDNRLPRSLGNFAFNSSLSLNSALGYGEQFYVSGSTGYNLGEAFSGASPLQILGGGFSFPIGVDGLRINPEYINSITRPAPTAGFPTSVGYFQRFDFRVSYPVIETRSQTITVQGAYEWDEERLAAVGFNTDLYLDRYSVARLQVDDRAQIGYGSLIDATLAFSQGLGGRGAGDAAGSGVPLSQQGASPTFSKLTFNARWTQPLPNGFQGALIGQAQTSFGDPLFVSEQLYLDGVDAISGFPSGTFSVDEGATLRAELRYPFEINGAEVKTEIAPYLFGVGGRGVIDQPTAIQQGAINAGSFGVGVRTGADAVNLPLGGSLDLELARFLSDVAGERAGYRGNVAFTIRF